MTRKNALGLSYVWPRMQRIRPRVGHDLMRRLNFRVSPRWLATGRPMARSTARTPQPLGSNPPARRDGDTAARKEHGEKEMTKKRTRPTRAAALAAAEVSMEALFGHASRLIAVTCYETFADRRRHGRAASAITQAFQERCGILAASVDRPPFFRNPHCRAPPS
jgi:hypothetical protein